MDLRLLGVVVVPEVVCEMRYFEDQRHCGTRSVAEMAGVCSVLLDLQNSTRGSEGEGHMRHTVASRAQQLRIEQYAGHSIVLDRG